MNNQPQMPTFRAPLINRAPSPEEQAAKNKQQIELALNQMTSSLYARLAARYLGNQPVGLDLDKECLSQMAEKCREAAVAYGVGMGWIEMQEPEVKPE